VDRSYTQGFEFNSRYRINNNFSISGGYQLLFARDKDAESTFKNGKVFARIEGSSSFRLDGNDYFGLFNRSRHMANFKIFYAIPRWNLNANLRIIYRSKYGLYDTNGNTYLDTYDAFIDAYTLWDIAFNKTFYKHYKLGFGVDNLFHFTHTDISNIHGRIIYGKININF
jgi:outer membrane receptor for ferrienterochelin and colicins